MQPIRTILALAGAACGLLLSSCGGGSSGPSGTSPVHVLTGPATFVANDMAYDATRRLVYVCGSNSTTPLLTDHTSSTQTPVVYLYEPSGFPTLLQSGAVGSAPYSAIDVSDDTHYAILGAGSQVSFMSLDGSPALAAITVPNGQTIDGIHAVPGSGTEFLVSTTSDLISYPWPDSGTYLFQYSSPNPLGTTALLGNVVTANGIGTMAYGLNSTVLGSSQITGSGLQNASFLQTNLPVAETWPTRIAGGRSAVVTDAGAIVDPITGNVLQQLTLQHGQAAAGSESGLESGVAIVPGTDQAVFVSATWGAQSTGQGAHSFGFYLTNFNLQLMTERFSQSLPVPSLTAPIWKVVPYGANGAAILTTQGNGSTQVTFVVEP